LGADLMVKLPFLSSAYFGFEYCETLQALRAPVHSSCHVQ
jgi:hypothetical protein